jgi:cyclin-dependent kinase 10
MHADKARDRATGEIVALKKVRFDDARSSRDGVPVTSIRELRVLQSCRHQNIVQLKKVVTGSKLDR